MEGMIQYIKNGVVKMNEKEERFKRIAEKRTNKILEQLRLLGNCSNKNNYYYRQEEVKKIFSVIEDELKQIKFKFSFQHSKEKFKL